MKVSYSIVFCVGVLACPVWAMDTGTALSKLENARLGITRFELNQCITTIRSDPASIDPTVWVRLKPVILDNLVHLDVRRAALQLSCVKANSVVAEQILSLVNGWEDGSNTSGLPTEESARQKALAQRSQLVGTVLGMNVIPFLEAAIQDQAPLLRLIARRQATQALLNNPAPLPQRRECALLILQQMRMQTNPAHQLFPLLDSSCYPAMRTLVASSSDPLDFHYCAAATLAYSGDQPLLPILESKRPGFRSANPSSERFLTHWIWLINVQNPPSKLLDYISSEEDKDVIPFRRGIAIRRALELGLSTSQIRDAILAFTGHFPGLEYPRFDHPLALLRRLGLKLNVLQESDLLNVSVVQGVDLSGISSSGPGEFPVLPDGSHASQDSKPARQPWMNQEWQPKTENYTALEDWMRSVDWESLSGDEATPLLQDKLCELDLIPPKRCGTSVGG